MKENKETGFTLLEIMIVLAVIGILSMVFIPKVGTLKLQAKEAGLDTNVRMIRAYTESKIDVWALKNIPLSDIQNAFAVSFGIGKELRNPISMLSAPAPAAGADLTDPLYSDLPVYIAGTFDGLDIGNASNKQYLKGTIVVAVKGITNTAGAPIHSVHIYAHDSEGRIISETIVSVDATGSGDPAGNAAVTGVTLNKTTLTLFVGDNEELIATLTPADATNQNVIWSSDTPSVASVNAQGLVTGITAGQAAITIETEDGGYQAICTLTVNNSLPDYPVWENGKRYQPPDAYVLYDERVFYARFDTDDVSNYVPGVIYNTSSATNPWQEVTEEWRAYNVYLGGGIVWHNGLRYKANWYSYNIEPGSSNVWSIY